MTEEELKEQTRLSDKNILEIRSNWLILDCPDEETATKIALERLQELLKAQQAADYPVFVQEGRRQVLEWIWRNAVHSHEPACEHIRIGRREWDDLENGIIPDERKHNVFKNGGYNNGS